MPTTTPPRLPVEVKPGDTISAKVFNTIMEAIKTMRIIPGGGIETVVKPGVGTMIRTSGHDFHVAKASGVVSARSGVTPGEGTATVYRYNQETDELESTGLTITVKNFGAASNSDAYLWVEKDAGSTWWLVSEACDA